jgi:hypothetical protein
VKAIHFNYALHPEKSKLPACMIGAIGGNRNFSDIHATTDGGKVTCKRCRKALSLDARGKEKLGNYSYGHPKALADESLSTLISQFCNQAG